MQTPLRCLAALSIVSLFVPSLGSAAQASNVGKRHPSEMRTFVDKVTGLPVTALTSSSFSDSKPYQTHTTWTSDGRWIVFRSTRGANGSQAFVVNETTGDIIQLTDDPATNTGSLNLSRKEMKLFLMRGGPRGGGRGAPGAAAGGPASPRQLLELNIGAIITDSLAGAVKEPASYERVIATLPTELRDSGGFALDADESKIYWGVAPVTPPSMQPAAPAAAARPTENLSREELFRRNTDPNEPRDAARARFELAGRGPGGIRSIDVRTGEIKTVLDIDLRMGHVQANPWVPGEIFYCHETTGDAPQRMWVVRGDGTGHRPLYVETPDEWVTHETVATADEVMFNLMGHLPYLREHATGVAVINVRTNRMQLLGQIEEDMGGGRLGGYWHCNGSPDGRWAVADSFRGDIYIIDRLDGRATVLTTGHVMQPDHAHPIFSPDSKRIAIQSGLFSNGANLNLMVVTVPQELQQRR